MEITAIALQTVEAGQDVAFTETAVNGTNCYFCRRRTIAVNKNDSYPCGCREPFQRQRTGIH